MIKQDLRWIIRCRFLSIFTQGSALPEHVRALVKNKGLGLGCYLATLHQSFRIAEKIADFLFKSRYVCAIVWLCDGRARTGGCWHCPIDTLTSSWVTGLLPTRPSTGHRKGGGFFIYNRYQYGFLFIYKSPIPVIAFSWAKEIHEQPVKKIVKEPWVLLNMGKLICNLRYAFILMKISTNCIEAHPWIT